MHDLTALLQTTFGHSTFRANQEAVCRAATDGSDVLLVMPTGAGKSLCYQLPAIARGGTALVVSPLIALMDDQAAKLSSIGLRVARIHSGLSRDDARQACRDYLDGTLNFLFIAPERMRVPGFPEMLARRKPSLIAIDEAHCISAWGHDFRPDYRTLGEHLPALRPAPIIALTATATPTVQHDIVAQLNLTHASLFIHGFRRNNLAIEVVEMSKPRRHEFTATLLADPAARPAIVYAPSRKSAEELANELARHFPAAAYHAGLDPATRERVQTAFQSGKLQVVVATIAFGMGIDKADVRTVVHTGLPSSVEAFYQEIGRAGRDGLPSRTVLLHSYADRKMHEFFLERDYPPAGDLARVAQTLTDDYLMPEPLAQRLKMDLGTFLKAIEKLSAQGAATVDFAGNVRATGPASTKQSWRAGYDAQIAFRRTQLDRMAAFAEGQQCRMTAIIQHFGDTADATRPCGKCDVCNPTASTAQTYHQPDTEELRQLAAILRALDGQSRSTGKLHSELAESALRGTAAAKDRKAFDVLVDALTRAGLVNILTDTFTNAEGNVINYRKASLTHEGREAAASGSLQSYKILVKDAAVESRSSRASKSGKSLTSRPSKASLKAKREETTASYTPSQRDLESRLRAWRKSEAAKTGKPAFMVFGDSALREIVLQCPITLSALREISCVSARVADNLGADIVALCRLPSKLNLQAVSVEDPAGFQPDERLRSFRKTVTVGNKLHPAKRKRDHTLNESENRRLDLEIDLRLLLKSQSKVLNIPVPELLSDEAVKDILCFQSQTEIELARLPNLRGDLPFSFYKALLETCNGGYVAESEPIKIPHRSCEGAGVVKERTSPIMAFGERTPTFHRTRAAESDPSAALTPDQLLLDTQLRAWRKSESERIGLPQFFVLGSSTLRSIVLLRPKTVAQLQTIAGIGPDKAEKFGASIVDICTA